MLLNVSFVIRRRCVKETKSNDQMVTCCAEANCFRMHFECFLSCHSIVHVATICNFLGKLRLVVIHFFTMKYGKMMCTPESGRTVTHRTKNEYNLYDKLSWQIWSLNPINKTVRPECWITKRNSHCTRTDKWLVPTNNYLHDTSYHIICIHNKLIT